jgi:hypothetical protein
MTSQNMATFRKLMEQADFEHDLASEKSKVALLQAFAPNFEIVQPPSLPQAGIHKGREQWQGMLDIMHSHWHQKLRKDHAWDVPEQDLIIMKSTLEWTAKATGRSITFPAVELFWFRDALIARVEMFFQDTKAILDTLEPTWTHQG